MSPSLAPVLLLLLPAVVLAILLFSLHLALQSRDRLLAVVLGLTCLHEVPFVLSPVWFAVFNHFELEAHMLNGVTPEDLVMVMLGEAVFVALFAIGLMCRRRNPPAHARAVLNQAESATLSVLVMIGLWIAVDLLTRPVASLAESVAHAEWQSNPTWMDLLSSWCAAAFQMPALFAAALVLVLPKSSWWLRVCGMVGLGSMIIFGFATGLRGRITWVLLAVSATAIVFRHRKAFALALLGIVGIAPMMGALGDASYRFGLNTRLGGLPQVFVLPYLIEHISSSSSASPDEAVTVLMGRAIGPRNSVALYSLFDSGEGAGSRPILSAITFPIPRKLWTTKIPTGSSDQSPYGGAMYRVMSISYGSPYYAMGPFLASAHAYWEGGWPWLIAAGLLTGVVWRVILNWCNSQSLAMGCLFAFLFTSAFVLDGVYTALAPLYAITRCFWLSFLPLLGLRFVIGRIPWRWGQRRVGCRARAFVRMGNASPNQQASPC